MKHGLIPTGLLVFAMVSGFGCVKERSRKPGAGKDLEPGTVIHGFKLERRQFIPEMDGEGYLFRHEKTGARLLKVSSKDDNKVFSVAFKTPPPDDTGVPHIIEHSVLNGSERFPVKSPFEVLAQGSLSTFLNAMTSSDHTIYPVASRNDKDFMNLMHVYLDAVYKPLLHQDKRILMQEGWHYELESPTSPLVYKGVVYNEMKGAFSSPERQLYLLVRRALFPDNCYGKSSGGHPDSIPELTYEKFTAFHKKYYSPSNSYIYLYGDGDLEKELAFIDKQYLSGFERETVDAGIPLQKPLAAPQVVKGFYGIPEGAPSEKRTLIARASVFGRNTDQELYIALDILSDALVNHEAAPLRRALQEAGIGEDVTAAVDGIQQPVFNITVKNAKADDQARFEQVVRETLQKVAGAGFDPILLEGIVNLQEFQLREGPGAETGIIGAQFASRGWMFGDDPFLTLSYNREIAAIKSKMGQKYFEQLAQRVLLANPHTCTVVLEPKPGLEKDLALATEKKLAELKAAMSPEELDAIVAQTRELVAYQQRQDDPEALRTIPLLELADIEKKHEDFPLKHEKLGDVELLFLDVFSKGIVYLDLYFDASAVPQELIPYVQLYSYMIGLMSTQTYAYGDLQNQVNLHTGGIQTLVSTVSPDRDDAKMRPLFVMRGKAMPDKLSQMAELMRQQLLLSRWDDEARLRELLLRFKARFERNMASNGLNVAWIRLHSYLTDRGAYRDLIDGYAFYRFLSEVIQEGDMKKVTANLRSVQAAVVNRRGLTLGVTGQEAQLRKVRELLPKMLRALPEAERVPVAYSFARQPLNEGFQDASKVQYVVKGYDYLKLGHAYSGKMEVLSQLLSTIYLQNTVRVQGGAYGGFTIMDDAGFLAFASFRDPNLGQTLENYRGAAKFLSELDLDERALRRLIIGTISNLDQPLNPSEKGSRAVRRFMRGDTLEKLQRERDEVLSTTLEDLKGFAKLVEDVMARDVLCVVGNEKKIEEEKARFKKILPLRQ